MLYRSAQSSLRSGNYRDAITKLQKLEARFPFGRYAEQAQLELIYANFMSYQPEAARSAADRFIRLAPATSERRLRLLHQGSRRVQQRPRTCSTVSPQQISANATLRLRDRRSTDFSDFLLRHPDSEYAADARQRMVFLVNVLAQYEINVAKFYMRRGAFVAAANRARECRRALFAIAIGRRCTGDHDRSELAAWVCPKPRTIRCGFWPSTRRIIRPSMIKGRFVFRQQTFDRDRSWLNMMTFGLIDRSEGAAADHHRYAGRLDIPPRILQIRTTAKPNKPW